MRTFVMGDIHGAHKALLQCLERSSFDKNTDKLIQLGDVADGIDEVHACVEELLKIPNLIAIKGNHDEWLNEFILTGYHPTGWTQGGASTARSYLRNINKEVKLFFTGRAYKTALNPADIPEAHRHFFQHQCLYHIDDRNNCYVHGGFDRHHGFADQKPATYYWDRELWASALNDRQAVTGFNEIFIGHTSTTNWKTDQPMKAANIYNLDTGSGGPGRLTIMEVESKKFWQSDPVRELYSTP